MLRKRKKNQITGGWQQGRNGPHRKVRRGYRPSNLEVPRVIPYQIPRGFITMQASDAKFLNVAAAQYACNTTGSITHLDIVPQGTTVSSREGKAFRVKSCLVRGQISANTATTIANYLGYLVWDKQPNKVLPAITDILDSVSFLAFSKRENAGRFILLKKWAGVVSGNSTTPATGLELHCVDEYVRFPKDLIAECTVADNTGVIGNRINGALYFVTAGSVVAGTGDCSFYTTFRVNFTDR